MPTSNPQDILLKHEYWATKQILDACAKLSNEQFHTPFDMGPGSLHNTLAHMLGALRAWTDVLAGREMRPRPEGKQFSVSEMRTMLDDAAADIAGHAAAHPVDEIVTRERGGKTWSFTRGVVITHITTHGMHHRAQCLNMLRQLGVSPLPPSSVTEWMVAEDWPQ